MQMVTDRIRWSPSDDERSLLSWAADRAGAAGRHLAPVTAVGRSGDGTLVVEVERPAGTPLSSALDTLGVPTTGVAVTLTVPLLELAVAARAGALQVGTAGLDDVLVDDAGAVLLLDRPPGARPTPSDGTPDESIGRDEAGRPVPARANGVRRADQDGARVLLLAARVVWERTDEREPARPSVDAALAGALDGDVDAVRAALAVVRGAAAPRPVRWEPAPLDLLAGLPAPDPPAVPGVAASVLVVLHDLVERGVPLGGDRRLPLRRALVGVVVAAGTVAAVCFALA